MLRPKGVCDARHTDGARVRRVQQQMPDAATLELVVDTFAALAAPTRARIVLALSKSELCVCDIAELLHMTLSAISHQLRVLRRLHLVKYRKVGRLAYYSLDDEHASTLLAQVVDHVKHGRARQNIRPKKPSDP